MDENSERDDVGRMTPVQRRFLAGPKSLAREFVEILLFSFLFLLFVNTFVWQNFKIPTESMENSLLVGDHLTVNTFVFKGDGSPVDQFFPFRKIRRGDVVVFRSPRSEQDMYIKRCIGLPGDIVEIIDDRVLLNGMPLDEDYAFYKEIGMDQRDPRNGFRPVGYDQLAPGLANAAFRRNEEVIMADFRFRTLHTLAAFRERNAAVWQQVGDRLQTGSFQQVPPGFFLMMGDNRNFSSDSRSWGLVPQEMIRGRAWFVWWSYGEEMNSHQATGLARLKLYLQVVVTFWTRTHLDESFRLVK